MSDLINKPHLAAVVFDMDGLMFDSERIVQISWNVAGDRLGYDRLGDNIFNTLGMNAARRKKYFSDTYGEDFPFETFQVYTREAFQQEVNTNGLPMKTGLIELLTYLQKTGIPIAVATSSSEQYALANFNRAGILPYLDAYVTGNMVTNSKPHPEIYLKACELLGAAPSEAIALEDAPNGIRSALAAGLHTIMIPDLIRDISSLNLQPEAKLDTLLDVIPYIKEHFHT